MKEGTVMGKLELNKKKKKDALFTTAFELFTTKGLAKTTISDIVDQAGVVNLSPTRQGSFFIMPMKHWLELISVILKNRYILLSIIYLQN